MSDLPEFRNPPVVEVAVGVQFDPVDWMIAPRLGLVWEQFKHEFPRLQQHPPLHPMVEKLGVRRAPQLNLKLSSAGDMTPRIWMLNDEESELVQVQQDRFLRNWRKYQEPDRRYPRYEQHIRPSFLDSLRNFRRFLIDSGVSDIQVNQCELLYVNHVKQDGVWSDHRQLGKVFRGWNGEFTAPWQDRLENAEVAFRKILRDQSGNFVGRLHVQVAPAFSRPAPEHPEEEPVLTFTLTARGKPLGEGETGIADFLDLAHIEIVTTFDESTTPEMHTLWGKEQGDS